MLKAILLVCAASSLTCDREHSEFVLPLAGEFVTPVECALKAQEVGAALSIIEDRKFRVVCLAAKGEQR